MLRQIRKSVRWVMPNLQYAKDLNLYMMMALLVLTGIMSGNALAVTITAKVSGSLTPPTTVGDIGTTVINGDFEITRTGANKTVGNGRDEETAWVFDFTSLPTPETLDWALLTLTLTPKSGIHTDFVKIEGLPPINTSVIRTLRVGDTLTVQLELLHFYSSSDILEALTEANGRLPMLFRDDAIVSSASLTLVTPACIWEVRYEGFWDELGGGSVLGTFFVPGEMLKDAISDGFIDVNETSDWRFEWTGNDDLPPFTIRKGFGDASDEFTTFSFPVSLSVFPLEFSMVGGDPSLTPAGMVRAGDDELLIITRSITFFIDEPDTPFGSPSVFSNPPNRGISGSFSSGPLTRAFSRPVLRRGCRTPH